MDSIRVYIRVDLSGYPGNNSYPGSEEFGCSRVSGYQMDFHGFFVYFRIFLNFEYIFVGFGVSQQGACVLRCLWRFRTLRKTRTWNFGACTLCVLLNFVNFVYVFLSVLGSPSRVRVCCAACGASEPSEKTSPWFFGACTLFVLLILHDFIEKPPPPHPPFPSHTRVPGYKCNLIHSWDRRMYPGRLCIQGRGRVSGSGYKPPGSTPSFRYYVLRFGTPRFPKATHWKELQVTVKVLTRRNLKTILPC